MKPQGLNQTERDFQRSVIHAAEILGWRVYHTTYSIGSDKGYPDLTMIHPTHGAMWLELKGPRGRASQEQQEWIQSLKSAGQKAYIVHWNQWDLIESLLMGKEQAA